MRTNKAADVSQIGYLEEGVEMLQSLIGRRIVGFVHNPKAIQEDIMMPWHMQQPSAINSQFTDRFCILAILLDDGRAIIFFDAPFDLIWLITTPPAGLSWKHLPPAQIREIVKEEQEHHINPRLKMFFDLGEKPLLVGVSGVEPFRYDLCFPPAIFSTYLHPNPINESEA